MTRHSQPTPPERCAVQQSVESGRTRSDSSNLPYHRRVRGCHQPRRHRRLILTTNSNEEAMNIRRIPQRARRQALATVVGAAIVSIVALAPSAQGQDPQPQGSSDGGRMDPRQMIDLRMARMTETLKLDSAQETNIRWMLAQETMAMEELRKNGGGQRGGGDSGGGGGRRGGRGGGRRGGGAPPDSTSGGSGGEASSREMRAIRDSTNKQIEALLNPQQLTTFRQLFEQGQQLRPATDSAPHRGRGSS
jgi:hypothetical protein